MMDLQGLLDEKRLAREAQREAEARERSDEEREEKAERQRAALQVLEAIEEFGVFWPKDYA